MFRFFGWLASCSFIFTLGAAAPQPSGEEGFVSCLTNTQSLPSTIVDGCVSAITGEWLETETDFVLQGPEPLEWRRLYSSRQGTWRFNRPCKLELVMGRDQHEKAWQACLKHPSGASTTHKRRLSRAKPNAPFSLRLRNKAGLTNCGSKEISARSNLNNMKVRLDLARRQCDVAFGNGDSIRLESKEGVDKNKRAVFEAVLENKASGNRFQYGDQEVRVFDSSLTCCQGWIKWKAIKRRAFKVETSQGQEAVYKFEGDCNEEMSARLTGNGYRLVKASFSHRPQEEYEHATYAILDTRLGSSPFAAYRKTTCLTRKSRPNKRFVAIAYYHEGTHKSPEGGASLEIKEDDFRLYRVKSKSAPVGADDAPVVTREFLYKPQETHVFDAYKRRKIYAHDKQDRPIRLTRCLKQGDLNPAYSSDVYLWDGEEEASQGNLMGHYLEDGAGRILKAQCFDYDQKGNVLAHRLYGNLTGHNDRPIQLGKDKRPISNGVDCHASHFVYSRDGFNLLLEEKEADGRRLSYRYWPGTDRVLAKLLGDQDKTLLRQFYDYDDSASLTELVKDDGSGTDKNDLTNVSYRLISRFLPRKASPVGLPERIDELYWDPASGQEILLKSVVCFYSPQGKLVRQDHYDSLSVYRYSLLWEWDAHGNLLYEKDALGQETFNRYDENDNLIFKQGPCQDFYTIFAHDFSNRLIRVEEIRQDGKRFVVSNRYDHVGNLVASTDRLGRETRYVYDDFNRLTQTIFPLVLDENGYPLQPVSFVESDPANHVVKTTDVNGRATLASYNARGKPAIVSYPDGSQETFLYNLDGSLARHRATNGTIVCYQRDALGRVLVEDLYSATHDILTRKTYAYKGDKLVAFVDAEGQTTRYAYDGAGRLVEETFADQKKAYVYDSLSRVEKILEWFGEGPTDYAVKAFRHDLLNRVVEERTEDSAGSLLTAAFYAYDSLNNRREIRQETQAGVSVTTIGYTTEGPVKIVDAEGHETTISYDYPLNALNQLARQTTICDPAGKRTIKTQDALGRTILIVQQDAFGVDLSRQALFYDAVGNKARAVDSVILQGKRLNDLSTFWLYDAMDRPLAILEAFGTPDQKTTRFVYNALGQQEVIVKPNGVELMHRYDALGRLSHVESSDRTIAYSFQYNLNHALVKTHDLINGADTTRVLDPSGRPLIETLANGLTMRYAYDRTGRVLAVQLPDQTGVDYLYDAAFMREARRVANGQRLYAHQYQTYDQAGRLTSERLAGQLGQLERRHDRLGRLTALTSAHWKQAIPADGYDAAGNLRSCQVEDNIGSVDYRFDYDALNQLVKETGHQACAYQVDSLNNRLAKNGTPCEVNNLNQVLRQGDATCQYDANGNMIRKRTGQADIHYRYDAWDRLILSIKDGVQTERRYDAFNRRTSKISQGVESRYLYQGQEEIGLVDSDGQLQEFRLLGVGQAADIGAETAVELQGRLFVPLSDRQGHVVSLIDSQTGQVKETYRYTAFGEEQAFDEKGQEIVPCNPWRYASKRVDPETGLIYFGRRYLDPSLGKWISPDPLGFADGPNLYSYLHHSPFAFYDAYGLEAYAYVESVEAASRSPDYAAAFSRENERSELGYDAGDSYGLHSSSSLLGSACAGAFNGFCNAWSDPIDAFSKNAAYIGQLGQSLWDQDFKAIQDALSQSNWSQRLEFCCERVVETAVICQAAMGAASLAKGGLAVGSKGASFFSSFFKTGSSSQSALAIESRLVNTMRTAREGAVLSRGAENVNAGVNLNRKLSQLETAQKNAVHTRILPDHRIRYCEAERLASYPGPTRGACNVVEWNQRTGQSRWWYECHDHFGFVNRVHPKSINGQNISSPHYPLIGKELL